MTENKMAYTWHFTW